MVGIKAPELDELVEVFELSRKVTALRDPSAAITWARELMGDSKKLLAPSVGPLTVKNRDSEARWHALRILSWQTPLP